MEKGKDDKVFGQLEVTAWREGEKNCAQPDASFDAGGESARTFLRKQRPPAGAGRCTDKRHSERTFISIESG